MPCQRGKESLRYPLTILVVFNIELETPSLSVGVWWMSIRASFYCAFQQHAESEIQITTDGCVFNVVEGSEKKRMKSHSMESLPANFHLFLFSLRNYKQNVFQLILLVVIFVSLCSVLHGTLDLSQRIY